MSNTPTSKAIIVHSNDGFLVSATYYSPPASTISNKPLVILAPSTGVTQNLYRYFATYLVSKGLPSITFDYRYTGASWPMSTPLDASRESRADRIEILKREKNTKIDQHWVWDFTSVIIEGSERARSQGRDLVVVAHSVSGYLLPLVSPETLGLIDRVIFMAVASPYHGFYEGYVEERKRDVAALMKEATRLEYFPAAQANLGSEVPMSVGVQWSRWMDFENYWASDHQDRLNRYDRPTLSLSFSDDWVSRHVKQIDAIIAVIPNAPCVRFHITPKKVGWPQVNHVGGFAKQHGKPGGLWELMRVWLESGIEPTQEIGERKEFGPAGTGPLRAKL